MNDLRFAFPQRHGNPRGTIVAVLTLALLAFSQGIDAVDAAPGMGDEIEKSFQVRPGGVLHFDADLANVEIVTGDSDTLRVAYTRKFKVSTAEEANELRQKLKVEMEQTGATIPKGEANTVKVVVRFADDPNQSNRNKVRLDFRISMPRKFNLKLRTGGSAKVGDLDGVAKASTLGGSLTLGNVSGAVTATSRGGSLSIGDVGADLEARSFGGSVAIGHVNGRVIASAEGGSVGIDEVAGALEATAQGGSVAAYISKQPKSDSKITANAGSIELRLAAAVALTIDAACTAGRVSSDFHGDDGRRNDPTRLKSNINGGGQRMMLRATAGNIRLRK